MKKSIVFITSLLFLLCNKTNAQFKTSLVSDNSVSAGAITMTSRATGNDILQIGSDVYSVSVWDDAYNRPGIGWAVRYNGFDYNSFAYYSNTHSIFGSDVSLVTDGTDVYAIAVYYQAGNSKKYFWEVFRWDIYSQFFVSLGANSIAFNATSFGATLNIDANSNNDFAIIWDDNTANIYIVTGSTASGAVPALNNSGNVVSLGKGINPDVSLFYDANNNNVHVTYLNSSQNTLYVDDYSFSGLAGGSSNKLYNQLTQPLIHAAKNPPFAFGFPRIASPNSNGNANDWTVVVEENRIQTVSPVWYIEGFNNDNSNGFSSYVYNDGSIAGLVNIRTVPNYRPVVVYNDQSTADIMVGWTFDNSENSICKGCANPPSVAVYPLVLKCNNFAKPVNNNYWDVPASLIGNTSIMGNLSLSSRFASDKLFISYNDIINLGIFHKEIDTVSSAASFRTTYNSYNIDQLHNIKNIYFTMANSGLLFAIKIFDLNGKVVWLNKGNGGQIKNELNRLNENLPGSVYLAHLISDDGSISFTQKLYLGK